MFDATDLEIARREHAYEMGAESPADRSWSRFYDAADAAIINRGWGTTLDENEWDAGFSIDGAHAAWQAGRSVAQYLEDVAGKRRVLGL